MGKLYLVGLGLSRNHITNIAINSLKNADIIYFDAYTSYSCDIDSDYLSGLLNKKVFNAERSLLENESKKIVDVLNAGKSVAIAVIGDPMIATTHVSLILEARKAGHEVDIVPGVSVYCYFISKSMLPIYKFGKSSTIVKPVGDYIDPGFYYVLEENRARDLHTLFFLEPDLTASYALQILLNLEEKFKHNVIKEDDLAVIGSRLGCDDEEVFSLTIKEAINLNLKNPPHITIIPSRKLHYIEEEALKCLMKR
ncbi:MAG: diphthine synthase [Sulfolobus sp.]|nr:diphthine synthase [Sulfolobus sp.]